MEPVLDDESIQHNFDRLLELQNRISREINDTYAGRELNVLIDGESRTDKTVLQGRTDSNKVVNIKGDRSLIGKVVRVRITDVRTWSLRGEIIE